MERGAGQHVRFPAHEYDISLQNHLGPQHDWRNDLETGIQTQSLVVVVHGVIGAGKSRLIEMLTGMPNNSLSSNGRTIAGGYTEHSNLCRFAGQSGNTLYFIDTPGFGVTTQLGQETVLSGINEALFEANRGQAPLKRIYFMLDWNKDRNQVPEALISNMKVLMMVYPNDNVSQIKFIVSKGDQLQLTRERVIAFRREIRTRYRQCFQRELPESSILFVSASQDPRFCCIRQLTQDLALAMDTAPLQKSPRPLGNSEQVVRLTTLYEMMNLASIWYFKYTLTCPEIITLADLIRAYRIIVSKGDELISYLTGRILANHGKKRMEAAVAVAAVVLCPVIPVELAISVLVSAGVKGVRHMAKSELAQLAQNKLIETFTTVKQEYEALCRSCL